MKIITFNVNGIRARNKYLDTLIHRHDADILCFQEIRANFEQTQAVLDRFFPLYKYIMINPCTDRQGFAGVATLSKENPIEYEQDNEGRLQKIEYKDFILYNSYIYNSNENLKREKIGGIPIKKVFLENLTKDILKNLKKCILAGDTNTAIYKIDIASGDEKTIAYAPAERQAMKTMIEQAGLIDTYRYFNPKRQQFTYQSYRQKKAQCRFDYFYVQKQLLKKVNNVQILENEFYRSDHVIVVLELNF